MARSRPRSLLFWPLRVGWVLLATILGVEGLLRLALFHPGLLPYSGRLGNPELYFYGETPDFWLLRARIRGRGEDGPAEYAHPLLGWTSGRFDSETYAHVDEPTLAGRRPVILLGDSFAACHGELDRRFEEIMDEGPFGETHALLNYGVGGYGVDQIALLGLETLKRFQGQGAIFVLSILVDDDLNRVILPFRGHPKPWIKAETPRTMGIVRLPQPLDPGEYLDQYTPNMLSWTLRLVRQQLLMSPTEMRDASGIIQMQEDMRKSVAAAVLQFHDQLKAQGDEGFVMLFLNRSRQEGGLRPGGWLGWLESLLEGQRVPWVRASREIALHRGRTGRPMDAYFTTEGPGNGHYSALGNEVTHLALERGMRGTYDGPSYVLQGSAASGKEGEGAYSRWERAAYGSYQEADIPHTLMRPGVDGLASQKFELSQNARHFQALLRPLPKAEGATRLVFRTEAGDVAEFMVLAGAQDRSISVSLDEVSELELVAFPVEGQVPLAFFLIHPSLDHHRHGPMLKAD